MLNIPLPFSYIKNIRKIIQKFSKKYCTIGLQLNLHESFFDFQWNPGYIVVIKYKEKRGGNQQKNNAFKQTAPLNCHAWKIDQFLILKFLLGSKA